VLLLVTAVASGTSLAEDLNAGDPFVTDTADIIDGLLREPPSPALPSGVRARAIAHPEALNSVNLRVRFDTGSARLKPESIGLLDSLCEALIDPRLRDHAVLVAGHTDDTGSDAFNLALSLRRAESVRDYAVKVRGLDPARFVVHGFGERSPLNANASSIQREVNRRVETALLP